MIQQPSRFLPMLLALAIFMQMLDATILNTALPTIAADLNESALNMQSTIIAYALTLALLMPLSGWLCDRYGTRRIFSFALILFTAGSILCALAPNLSLLVLARVIQGMGGAMIAPVPRLVVMRAYDKSRLISIMNYVVMPALIGPVIGPILGGYLVEYFSWHWIFLINVPVGLGAVILSHKILPDFRNEQQKQRFDLLGFILFSSGAVGLSLAVELTQHAQASGFAMVIGLCGLLAFYGYLQHAKTDEQPLFSLDLWQVRTYRLGLVGNFASRVGMSAMPFMLPLLLQVGFGRDATVSGWVLAPVALASIVAKPLIKPTMKRFGYRRALSFNTMLIGIVIMLFALPNKNTPLWALLPLLILLGLCNSFQFTAMNTLTLSKLRPHQAASGTSLMTVNQQLAISFGTAAAAALLNSLTHWEKIAHNIQIAFSGTFIGLGLITFFSAFIFAQLHWRDGANLVDE